MVAEIGNGMADLLAAHFNSGLVAAKLGGGERPVCGNPGTGTLWRDLGFVAQRYVVKVLWYSRITFLFTAENWERNLAQLFSCFWIRIHVGCCLFIYEKCGFCIIQLSFFIAAYLFIFDLIGNNDKM